MQQRDKYSWAYGPKEFIGRKEELYLFDRLLNEGSIEGRWIFQINAAGGMGKTSLLNYWINQIKSQKKTQGKRFVNAEMIDIFFTRNKREIGILSNIASQLKSIKFTSFLNEVRMPPQNPDWEVTLVNEFVNAYKSLRADRIILFFDTSELSGKNLENFWQNTLPRLKEEHPGTIATICGRNKLSNLPGDATYSHEIKPFNADDVKTYLNKAGFDFDDKKSKIITNNCGGRPISVALTLDWLRVGNPLQFILKEFSPEEYQTALIERVLSLKSPIDLAIMAMAHLHRRFDANILAMAMGVDKREAQTRIDALARYSFVKYRPGGKTSRDQLSLHDEVRNKINTKLLEKFDPRKNLRRSWTAKILPYYNEKIEQSSGDEPEKESLQLEKLHYLLFLDVDQGWKDARKLFDIAEDQHNPSMQQAINEECQKYESRLQRQYVNRLNYQKAVVLHKTEDYSGAQKSLTNLLKKCKNDLELQREAVIRLIVLETDRGEPQAAITAGQEQEQLLLTKLEAIPESDPQYDTLNTWLGLLYNNLGFAYRSQNDLDRAADYFGKALNLLDAVGQRDARYARSANNLGFVYYRKGDNDRAIAYSEIASMIRSKLDIPYEMGLSYNVLGIIYADQLRIYKAKKCFYRALAEFDQVGSERGKALVYIAYARLLRQWCQYREEIDHSDNTIETDYQTASRLLDDAIKIFKELKNKPNLIEAMNEKGTLLRQTGDHSPALELFIEAEKLARSIKDKLTLLDIRQEKANIYLRIDKNDKAFRLASGALSTAHEMKDYYLYARTQRTIAEIYYRKGKFEKAFAAAVDACAHMLRQSSDTFIQSGRRSMLYDQYEDWLTSLILRLPSKKLAIQYSANVIQFWEETKFGGLPLAEHYPGFIIKLNGIVNRFDLLKMGGDSNV